MVKKASDYEDWPCSKLSNIVLKEDVGVELGSSETASESFLLWTEYLEIKDGAITIVGPDLAESRGRDIPFAQILILKGSFEDEYKFYKKFMRMQRDINLDGYMLKTTPRRIWSRVSKEALENGFSLGHLGRALINVFKADDCIDAAEVVFVTSSEEDVKELGDISNRVQRIVGAMNKMVEEMSLDCDSCEYSDVCNDVLELRRMRKKLEKSGFVHGSEKI